MTQMVSKYFSYDEVKCKHSGLALMDIPTLQLMDKIREECGFALPCTSGYRSADHPSERNKSVVGAHRQGKAMDFNVWGEKALILVEVALKNGIRRIGVNQTGHFNQRFVHLDTATDLPTPWIWSY